MGSKLVIGLVTAMLLVGFAPTTGAAEVGASGQCYDEDGSGGKDETSVNSNGDITILTGVGAVNAVVTLLDEPEQVPGGNACSRYDCGDQPVGNGTSCDTDGDGVPDREPRKDYLEVHVDAGEAGHSYQVCYDGDPHVPEGPGDNAYPCPTSPNGPGGEAAPVALTDVAVRLL